MTGSLKHLGGDRWKVRIYAGLDPDGRQQVRSKNFRAPNQRAAERAVPKIVAALQEDIEEQRARADTVAGLADQWLDLCRNTKRLSPSTLASYERIAARIVERFGRRRVADLTTRDVDRWYSDLLAAGQSPANVHAYHRVLRAMLRKASDWQMVDRVVTKPATVPRADKVAHRLPTAAALDAVLDSTDVETRAALRLLAASGCRRGELVGLQWTDLDGDVLHIRRSLLDVKGHRGEVKSTKTRVERDVDLDPATLAVLDAWRIEHERRCRDMRTASPWMFPSWETGGQVPYRPSWLSHLWAALRAEHGIDARLHDIRHWHISTLIARGVPVIEASKRVGHSQVSTTLNVYGNLVPGDRGRASAVIAGELGKVRSRDSDGGHDDDG